MRREDANAIACKTSDEPLVALVDDDAHDVGLIH